MTPDEKENVLAAVRNLSLVSMALVEMGIELELSKSGLMHHVMACVLATKRLALASGLTLLEYRQAQAVALTDAANELSRASIEAGMEPAAIASADQHLAHLRDTLQFAIDQAK